MSVTTLLKKSSMVAAGAAFVALGTAEASNAALMTFGDRASFDAAAPGLAFEDFEEANIGAGGVAGIPAPLDSTTNNGFFSTGDIEEGIQFVDNPGPDTNGLAVTGDGFAGLTSKKVFANTFVDTLDILFTQAVNAVGFDLVSAFNASDITISIFGANGLLGSNTVAASTIDTFFGVISDTDLITRINLASNTDQAEGVDNIAFGQVETDTESVPEPASILGLMTVGALGAGSALKRRKKQEA